LQGHLAEIVATVVACAPNAKVVGQAKFTQTAQNKHLGWVVMSGVDSVQATCFVDNQIITRDGTAITITLDSKKPPPPSPPTPQMKSVRLNKVS
jgi:hypothetical protein